MSLAARLALPEMFQTTLLVLALALTLAPYLSGLTVGGLTVPKLDARRRRTLRAGGPIALACVMMLVVPLPALRPVGTTLHLAAVDVTDAGEIDVAITNAEATAALLTRIELEVLEDHHRTARPALISSARYHLPVDGLRAGESREIVIRHVIAPLATERIVIAPDTPHALRVRLRIRAAAGPVLSADVEL